MSERQNNIIEKEFDLVVCGGGIGGILTAISASRQGLNVALIDDKTGLGGNANAEIGIAIEGASFFCYYPNMREGGLVEEMKERLAKIDPFNRKTLYSVELLFWLEAEGVQVFSELLVDQVDSIDRKILSVSGAQGGTERHYRFKADQFVDATGDGSISAMSGCEFKMGREARCEYGELLAPLEADKGIMGASIQFRASKKDVPSTFTRPDWAYHYKSVEDLPHRLETVPSKPDHGFWWIEYAGSNNDPIGDYEEIRRELHRCLMGTWDFLKNDPSRGLEYWSLDSISISPGKRESRRIIGDHVLTESDIVEQVEFEDTVAYAGWNLDIHVPGGFKSPLKPNVHAFFPWVAHVPLRSLYTRDKDNLWLMGRDMSVSHVALGATRLQATIGAMGHAVGIAAAYAARNKQSCRETAQKNIQEIQQQVLKDGSFIPGIRNEDSHDLAQKAKVSANSEAVLNFVPTDKWIPVGKGRALSFPVTTGVLDKIKIPLRNESDSDAELKLYFSVCDNPNTINEENAIIKEFKVLKPGEQTLTFEINAKDLPKGLYSVLIISSGEVSWQQSDKVPYGTYTYRYEPEHYLIPKNESPDELFAADKPIMMTPKGVPFKWIREKKIRWEYCGSPYNLEKVSVPSVQLSPVQNPYAATEVQSGLSHSDILPELWISDNIDKENPTLTLEWEEEQSLSEVRLVFDTDLDMPQPSTERVETLVKSYSLEYKTNQGWKEVVHCEENEKRFSIHRFTTIKTNSLRLVCKAIHRGGKQARVFEIRCYR